MDRPSPPLIALSTAVEEALAEVIASDPRLVKAAKAQASAGPYMELWTTSFRTVEDWCQANAHPVASAIVSLWDPAKSAGLRTVVQGLDFGHAVWGMVVAGPLVQTCRRWDSPEAVLAWLREETAEFGAFPKHRIELEPLEDTSRGFTSDPIHTLVKDRLPAALDIAWARVRARQMDAQWPAAPERRPGPRL